jgi:hypothetical protein
MKVEPRHGRAASIPRHTRHVQTKRTAVPTSRDTYVDGRHWRKQDWRSDYPCLVSDLVVPSRWAKPPDVRVGATCRRGRGRDGVAPSHGVRLPTMNTAPSWATLLRWRTCIFFGQWTCISTIRTSRGPFGCSKRTR